MEIVVIGGGVIGLSAAVECQRRGHRVVLVEKSPEKRGSSLGNAGMIVPSHFVPLAAPGMVALGFKWMWNPESPFYIRPSLDPSLVGWGMRFIRSATKQHVDRSAPLLRDLHMASRQLYVELSQEFDIGLEQRGLVMLCKTQAALDEEAHMAERSKGSAFLPMCSMPKVWPSSILRSPWMPWVEFSFRKIATCSPIDSWPRC